MEIPETKRFIPKGFELGTTLSLLNHYFSHYFLLFTIKFITLFLFCFFHRTGDALPTKIL